MVTIVAREVFDAVEETLGIELKPGDLAENFLTQGLGDLADLAAGDRIRLGEEVVIEVTGQNRPCAVLHVYHGDIVEHLMGRRGIVGKVVNTGVVRPGDRASVETAGK